MQFKLNSPVAILLFLSVGSALTLGGAPPSAGTEENLAGSYEEPAIGGVGSFYTYSLAANLVPVPLQVQLTSVLPDEQASSKALYQHIGGVPGVKSETLSVPAKLREILAATKKSTAPASKKPYLVHTVGKGDTISSIAKKYGISVDTLVNINMLGSIHQLKVGQKLNVITVEGLLYTVKKGESLWDIAKRYKIDVQKIVDVNGLGNADQIKPNQMIVLPGAKMLPQPVAKKTTQATKSTTTKAKSTPVVSSRGNLQRGFQWPVRGRISSRFGSRWGRMHEGIDIAVSSGTPVRAAASGRVTFSGWGGAYGYLVKVDHGNGVETRYAHNSRLLVSVGQHVDPGQVLARSGNTGRSTGPHVHFEVRKSGKPYNPLSYLR